MTCQDISDDTAWQRWSCQWRLRADTIYLNHGSFGPPPEPVRQARREWLDELDRQPMDFFVRRFPAALDEARARLAAFVGAAVERIVFVENATSGMNVVASCFPFEAGDEVLLTDHEYGAVRRIWERACQRRGLAPPRIATLPLPVQSSSQIVEAIFSRVTPRTRLLVLSHITSPTAMILPVEEICAAARQRAVAVCIDGPHALLQLPLALDKLGCDFYTASCHKWLCAPFGSGLLYVAPPYQRHIEPRVVSWGVLRPGHPEIWTDEFCWSGTRDPTAYLTVPAAIDFFEQVGLEAFRRRTHWLARYARQRLLEAIGLQPLTPDSPQWYGSMALVPLPPGDARQLQQLLWQRHRIEVPVIDFSGRRLLRVSCHLYNNREQIDRLVEAVSAAVG